MYHVVTRYQKDGQEQTTENLFRDKTQALSYMSDMSEINRATLLSISLVVNPEDAKPEAKEVSNGCYALAKGIAPGSVLLHGF